MKRIDNIIIAMLVISVWVLGWEVTARVIKLRKRADDISERIEILQKRMDAQIELINEVNEVGTHE